MQPDRLIALVTRLVKVPYFGRRGRIDPPDYRTLRKERIIGSMPNIHLEHLEK